MAKQTTAGAQVASATEPASCVSLAERLFAAQWRPGAGYTPEHLANQCLEAADAFKKAESERLASFN